MATREYNPHKSYMLMYWLWKKSLLIGQLAVVHENTLGFFCTSAARDSAFNTASVLPLPSLPLKMNWKLAATEKQHKTTLTCPTKQHLTNKHFITAFCWLNWTPMKSRCTAGILKPLSRDRFAVFVQQWQQGHEEVRASGQTDVKKKIASTPTDVWIYFCLHTPSVLHESAHMEHWSQKQI